MSANQRIHKITKFSIFAGIAVCAVFIVSATISAYILQKNSIKDKSGQLSNIALIISDHAAQTMFAGSTALQSLVDEISLANIQNEKSFIEFAGKRERFNSLKDKTSSNSIIDVASYVDSSGEIINFSRSYPPPPINLAERDYFKYLSTHNSPDVFYSNPVRNKGNQKWVFYLARRINNNQGDF